MLIVLKSNIISVRGRRVICEVCRLDIRAIYGDGIGRVKVPQGLGVELRPGAGRKHGEHLFEEIVVGGGIEVTGALVDLVMLHLRILDLLLVVVVMVTVMEVLHRNLRRV
ncbi:hypothetical protein L6164_011516 [Bauhinia variegata]|uniref:Uncharacterized protein n=1 Tax=Bauhinia variegata TaxID=167791 RepID=A0ACB9PBG1_BAUVA|nr:hypothetical protein L6164_011516 [Bauhinia variegata]